PAAAARAPAPIPAAALTEERFVAATSDPDPMPAIDDPAAPVAEIVVEAPRASPAPSIVDLATHPALRGRLRTDVADNAQAWRDILAYLREESGGGGFTLRIPPGVYRFQVDAAQPVAIAGLHDVTIDGQGAEFRYSHAERANLWQSALLSVRGCERLRIANLTLDWDWDARPLASFATVAAIAADRSEVRLRIDAPTPERKAAFAQFAERYMDLQPWDPSRGGIGVPWVNELGIASDASLIMSRAFAAPGRWDGGDLVLTVQERSRDWIGRYMPVGAVYAVRHYVYETAGLKLEDSSHVGVDGLTIHSCPGIGVVMRGRQHHTALRRLRIEPRPGTFGIRPFSAAADGLHATSTQGSLLLEDCTIRSNADDAINLHDNVHRGMRLGTDARHVALVKLSGKTPFAVGDQIEVRGPDYRPQAPPFRTRVMALTLSGVPGTPERRADLELAEPLPSDLQAVAAQAFVLNRAYDSGGCIIRRCDIGGNKGRGLLVEVPRVLIEDCRIADNRKHAIDIGIELGQGWGEGYGPEDVTVRRCVLENSNIETVWNQHRQSPVLRIGASIGDYNLPSSDLRWGAVRRVLITDNAFRAFPGAAMQLISGSEVVVRGNVFQNLSRFPAAGRTANGAVLVAGGGPVSVVGNVWMSQGVLERLGVVLAAGVDPAAVLLGGNRLASAGAADETITIGVHTPRTAALNGDWDLVVPIALGPQGGRIVLEDPLGGRFDPVPIDTAAAAEGVRIVRLPLLRQLAATEDLRIRIRTPGADAASGRVALERWTRSALAAGGAMAVRLEPRVR
ncbi:MAG: right-handed parallel beta-helix repeat-containing protein, partial [Planctomycetes bacterium]|nr:right-handed parallel beta-helix repeat-containing protein [Planctomycetota bacterium]